MCDRGDTMEFCRDRCAMDATREPEEVSQLPSTWHFAFEKSLFPCFPP